MVAIMQFALPKHRLKGSGGVISDWYADDLSTLVRVEFHRTLKDLRMLPAARWGRPEYGLLSNGIGEIRFKKEGKAWRPLGCFLPREIAWQLRLPGGELEVFVLLIGACKRQGSRRGRDHENWDPRNARETAVRRRDEIHATGKALIHAYTITS
jgi:hypothetical protein